MLINGDFREILPTLGVKADLICADLPFGKTKNPWDLVIPFEEVGRHLAMFRTTGQSLP